MKNRFITRAAALLLTLGLTCPSVRAQSAEVTIEGRRFQITVTPLDPPAPTGPGPKAPTSLMASAKTFSVDVIWVDEATDETGYVLWRKTGTTGVWLKLGTLAPGTVKYTDWMVTPADLAYTYRVQAVGNEGASAYSNEVTVTMGPIVELPPVPVPEPPVTPEPPAPPVVVWALEEIPAIHSVRSPLPLPVDFARSAKLIATWEVNGVNFGAEPGQVLVNGISTPFFAWHDRRVMIAEPPTKCTITVQRKDGAYVTGMYWPLP